MPQQSNLRRRSLLLCGLITLVFSWQSTVWAQPFEAALASCAKQTRFCENESYNEHLCEIISDNLKPCDTTMIAGTLCALKLKKIAPTQSAVGQHVAECKAKKLKAKDKKDKFEKGLTRYLLRAKRHVPTIIGPGRHGKNRFYITDHHHLSYAMHLAHSEKLIDKKQNHVIACILTNRSTDKEDLFWDYMVDNHLTWLGNQKGAAISTTQLQNKYNNLDSLEDYPFRSWSRWVRDSCGYIKKGNDCVPQAYPASAPYFMEFKWADYMHNNLPQKIDFDLDNIGKLSDKDIQKVLKVAIELVQGDQAFLQGLPGYSDGTVIHTKQVKIDQGCEVD